MNYYYLNGRYHRESENGIHVNNRSFRYGDGFFETMRYRKGKLSLQLMHIARIQRSLSALKFEEDKHFIPGLIDAIDELVHRNKVSTLSRIRVTIFRGEGGLADRVNNKPNLLVQAWKLDEERIALNENGLILGLYQEGIKAADHLANIKSNNYLLYALAAMEARERKWNDAVVLNHHGRVADTTIANIWAIRQGELFTPSLQEGPVAGVMREHIIQHCKTSGLVLHEGVLTAAFFEEADGIFITNAIMGVKWVKAFNDRTFSLPKEVHTLHAFTML